MSRPFVHLHTHSDYSLLDGAIPIKRMVARAVEYGMPALALTDHGNLFGAIRFYLACRKAGIKPIIGMEAYTTRGDRKERGTGRATEIHHLVLLCRNFTGYRNLVKLSSLAYQEGFYYKPRVDRELLRTHHEGLIALGACMSGEVNRLLVDGNYDAAKASALELRDIFGDGNYYLEIQDHGIPEEERVREGAARLSRETGIPLVATNDCHYLDKGDHEAHAVLLCINTGRDLEDEGGFRVESTELYFKSGDEMAERFADFPAALDATLAIAEACDLEIPLGELALPRFPLPEGFASPDAYLRRLAEEGLARRCGEPCPERTARLDYELGVIEQMGYAGYFLITRDFIQAARDRDIAVGPGRGSAAGSLVCYSLGITDLDPLEHGLLFERFLNPARVSMPDIDIDFDYVRRGEVIDYVTGKYGKDNVCQIITFGTMKARAVIRDVGRVLRLPFGEVDRIAKLVPETLGMTLDKAMELNPELADLASRSEPWPYDRLIRYSRTLEGLTRHASTHAAGVLITPDPLIEHLPLYVNNKGEVTTQYDMVMCEKIGLLKMDFLGLRTLTVIEDALDFVNAGRPEGERLRAEDIPLDDAETFALLRRADTVGTFQLESAGMRDILRRLQPTEFSDIVATNALFRPGPIGSGMVDDFIDRKQGRKRIDYAHPDLEPYLAETYGAVVYQEQVMQVASVLAGFDLGQADLLRRAMGKKKPEEMAKQREAFLAGAKTKGYDAAKAGEVFDLLAYFAGYGFNKSHSAAYAVLSMRTAWLKTHHTAEYLAACMTSEMGNTDRIVVFMNECRDRDIEVVPPDVQRSHSDFRVDGGRILFGLCAVKNVGLGAIEEILRAREAAGPFEDLYQFCESIDLTRVNRKVLESLVCAGAMDSLGPNRPSLLGALDEALASAQGKQRERAAGQFSLLDALGDEEQRQVRKAVTVLADWDRKEKLAREKEMLGFFVSGHPLDDLRETVLALPVANAASLKELPDRTEARTVGIVTALKRKIDSKDRTMAFLTVEDYLGSYEVIAFSSVFGDCQARLQVDAIIALEGRTNLMESGEAKLLLDRVLTLDEALAAWPRDVHLHLAPGFRQEWLADLERELRAHPGSQEVFFHLPDADGKPVVLRARGLAVETGAWLADFLRAHRERLSCRLTPRPLEPARKGGWRGNGRGGNGRDGRSRGAAAPF